MDNCREEFFENDNELVESYTFEDARTGYNCLSEGGHEVMNAALNKFLKRRGKLHTLKEIMKQDFNRKHGKN